MRFIEVLVDLLLITIAATGACIAIVLDKFKKYWKEILMLIVLGIVTYFALGVREGFVVR